jgi:hypothetical protein
MQHRAVTDRRSDGTVVASSHSALDPARVPDLTELLGQRLPLSAADLGRLLVVEGFAATPLTPVELAGAYKQLGRPVPFRLVRHRGAAVIVRPNAQAAALTVMTMAAQFVRWWGVAEVGSLIGRIRVTRPEATEEMFVRRVLAAMPQVCWLDGNGAWFSLRGLRSRLGRVVSKVFGVLGQVTRADLLSVLWKGDAPLGHPPVPVILRCLADVLHCEVGGEHVRPLPLLRAETPTPAESVLLEALRAAGGELPLARLKRDVRGQLPAWKVRHLVESSPLFVPGHPHRVRMIGPPPVAQGLGASSRSAITPW